MSLLARLDRFPPFICRLLARKNHGHAGLSHAEIAQLSGLPKSTVSDLSFKTTWAGVDVKVADRFASACGVDFFRTNHKLEILYRHKGVYLYRGPASQRAMYAKLFTLLKGYTRA